MKVFKKISGGIAFVRKAPYEYDGVSYEADIKNGDTIKIMDAGNLEVGQFGEQHNFRVKTKNGEKKLAFNQKTINVLFEEFGDDTEDWVGKDVKVIMKKDTIAGKRVEIVYLVVGGWELDEYGDLNKPSTGIKRDESDEIEISDVPF